MAKKHTYRIVFHNQGKLYELYARHVSHGEMYGFVEVGDIIFGERTEVIVDPYGYYDGDAIVISAPQTGIKRPDRFVERSGQMIRLKRLD